MRSRIAIQELRLNLKYQYKPSLKHFNLLVDFLYGGCFDEIWNEIAVLIEQDSRGEK